MFELTRLGVRMGLRGLGFRILLLATLALLEWPFSPATFPVASN